MITGILLFILSVFIYAIAGIFATLQLVIPVNIIEAITWAFSFVGLLNGLIPIATLFAASGFVLSVWLFFYVVKIALWIWSMLPWVGKEVEFPSISITNVNRNTNINRIK